MKEKKKTAWTFEGTPGGGNEEYLGPRRKQKVFIGPKGSARKGIKDEREYSSSARER